MTRKLQVFIAFPRQYGDMTTVMDELADRFKDTASLHPSSQVFHDSFEACGSWDAWIKEVSTGVNMMTRQPKFDVFVSPFKFVGRATASIFEKALKANKDCFVMGRNLTPVTAVACRDSNNWKAGWSLVPASTFSERGD